MKSLCVNYHSRRAYSFVSSLCKLPSSPYFLARTNAAVGWSHFSSIASFPLALLRTEPNPYLGGFERHAGLFHQNFQPNGLLGLHANNKLVAHGLPKYRACHILELDAYLRDEKMSINWMESGSGKAQSSTTPHLGLALIQCLATPQDERNPVPALVAHVEDTGCKSWGLWALMKTLVIRRQDGWTDMCLYR